MAIIVLIQTLVITILGIFLYASKKKERKYSNEAKEMYERFRREHPDLFN